MRAVHDSPPPSKTMPQRAGADSAVLEIVRLLARQAAREWLQKEGLSVLDQD